MTWFLFKTEPSEFSYDDLERAGRTRWEGVSNAAALIALRRVRAGDGVFIYHTGSERAVVGLGRAAGSSYEDPARPGHNDRGEPRFAVVDVEPVKRAATPVTLDAIRKDPRFAKFPLVVQSRLSVMAVPEELADALRRRAGL